MISGLTEAQGDLKEVKEQSDLNMALLSEVDNRSQDNAKVLKSLDTTGLVKLEARISSLESAMTMLKNAFLDLHDLGY